VAGTFGGDDRSGKMKRGLVWAPSI